MSLQLNNAEQIYQEFYGRNIDQMPALIKQGFLPIPVAQLMQRRLDVLGKGQDLVDTWWNNYFDTGDAIAYHPDGQVKIDLDSSIARQFNPGSNIVHGKFVLPEGEYEQIAGQEFSKEETEKYALRKSLTLRQAMNNPIWRALARDPKLHEEYAKAVFKEANTRYGNERNMGVCISNSPEVPSMGLWLVGGLDYGYSLASGSYALDGSSGRLVGVAPEAQYAAKITSPSLDQILAVCAPFIAPANMAAVREGVGKLYQ